MQRRYILVDACVAAAAYAPKTTRSANLVARSHKLLNGTPSAYEAHFLIPNYCIGETFSVFEKYRWGATWNSHVSAASRLTPTEFVRARESFHAAIHNGTKLLQVALDRYHILCLDLISPINAAYRIKRNRGKKTTVRPASTYDLFLLAIGIWLQKQYGADDFLIVTGDERLALVAKRARSISLGRSMRAHLAQVADSLGLTYGPGIYPEVVDLVHWSPTQLRTALPHWTPAW